MGPDASLTPESIQAQTFTSAFRGYDTGEVKAFLARVATEVRAWRERAEGLESAWHSAEERAARPPVLDEDTLMAAVGEETAAILRTARAAAAEMRAKAAEESDRTLSEARTEADRTLTEARTEAEQTRAEARSEAEQALTDVRAAATRLQQESEAALEAATAVAEEAAAGMLTTARQEAAELVGRATSEAEDIRAKAEKDRQLTIEGANTTRDRILEDLSRRRRVATVQIEQLRAGRERLIESYAMVRRTLEEVQSELSRADAEARAAADDVGRRLKDEPDVELSEASRAAFEVLGGEPAGPETALPGSQAGSEGDSSELETVEAASETAGGAQPAEVGEPADSSEAAGSAVDELFARIRATRGSENPAGSGAADGPTPEPTLEPTLEREEAVDLAVAAEAPAPAAAEAPAPAAPASRRGGRKRPGPGSAPTNGHQHAAPPTMKARATVRVIEAPSPAGEPLSVEASVAAHDAGSMGGDVAETVAQAPAETPAEAPAESPLPDGDESLLQARESAVADIEVSLTRRLKRTLQDEQNDVLDRLRNLKTDPSAERLLPDTAEQAARFAGAARPLLAEAASAGAVFTDETLGVPGRDSPVEVDVADLADECGSGIVSALRRRLEQAIEVGAGDDQAVLVESIGAAYREWKTQRIERLAGDVVSAAFSRGTWQAAPAGAGLRWVVEDADGPCPDCDDDALAGDIPKGEAFPTGQQHPPAHSGCRCLLVPSRSPQ